MTTTTLENVSERAFNPVNEFDIDQLRTLGRWSISTRKVECSSVTEDDQSRWIILPRAEELKLES